MSSTRTGAGGATFAARAQLSIERLLSRNVVIVALALAAAIALAWNWLGAQAAQPMSEMHGHMMAPAAPWSAAYLAPAFLMWVLMMVAMMLPSAAPMILLHARIDRAPTPGVRLWHTILFALCYLAVWAAFSALAAAGQALLVQAGVVEAGSLALGNSALAASVLALAGLYQLTAAKTACLDQCRSPLNFVMRYWRPGSRGTVRLGLVHGAYCVGCCWALMLLLFVGGVMNLAWVAALAVLVLAEKISPPQWRIQYWLAAALFAAAAIVLVASPMLG